MEQRDSHAAAPALGATVPLLVLVMILFALVVGYGWLRLLATALDPFAAGFVAALITVIALLLARMIGRAMLTGRSDPAYLTKLFFLYPVLFGISALGTINAAFYNFEGSSVLLQVIDNAERDLAALDGAAKTAFREEGPQAERAATVSRLLIQLEAEIKNPLNCGAGPRAGALIARIHAILPEFEELSRTERMRGCDPETLDAVYKTYERNALRMLGIDPARQSQLRQLAEISEPIAAARRRLVQSERVLATGGGFGSGYADAMLALENASTAYTEARERLALAAPDAAEPLAPAIDIHTARYLGSITAIVGTLASRLNYFTTWVYFLVAIGLDFLLIFLFLEALRGHVPVPPPPPPGLRDPQFLWVNQGA